MQSKASRNQLNLPHGTETKPEVLKKTVSSQSPLCQSDEIGSDATRPSTRRSLTRVTTMDYPAEFQTWVERHACGSTGPQPHGYESDLYVFDL